MWFGEGADSAGYEVPFTSLTMHAVSRGAEDGSNDFTSPCIYAQVEGTPPEGFGATIAIGGDGPATDADEGEEDDDEGDDEDDAGGFAMGGGDDGDGGSGEDGGDLVGDLVVLLHDVVHALSLDL